MAVQRALHQQQESQGHRPGSGGSASGPLGYAAAGPAACLATFPPSHRSSLAPSHPLQPSTGAPGRISSQATGAGPHLPRLPRRSGHSRHLQLRAPVGRHRAQPCRQERGSGSAPKKGGAQAGPPEPEAPVAPHIAPGRPANCAAARASPLACGLGGARERALHSALRSWAAWGAAARLQSVEATADRGRWGLPNSLCIGPTPPPPQRIAA